MTFPMGVALHTSRIIKLQRMLKARTDHDGKALPNFAENVAAIRAEIAKLQARIGD